MTTGDAQVRPWAWWDGGGGGAFGTAYHVGALGIAYHMPVSAVEGCT